MIFLLLQTSLVEPNYYRWNINKVWVMVLPCFI